MVNMIKLPYSLDALEPYYSRETLDIHYNKLYEGYVDNYNKTEQMINIARFNNNFENIKCLEKNLAFYGSGVVLHELFFLNMTNNMFTRPSEKLNSYIAKDFGGIEKMFNQFMAASKEVEASGWCMLVYLPREDKLSILQCEKHQNLTIWTCIPILVIDMWEHSYFLQYKQDREAYINNFIKIINFDEVNKRFETILK